MTWGYRDNNDGTFGSSGDLNSIYAAFAQMGETMLPGGVGHAPEGLERGQQQLYGAFQRGSPRPSRPGPVPCSRRRGDDR